MSWQGPSAPRVEGIATKSRVVASCASKPASTASRIFCLVSMAFIASLFPLPAALRMPRAPRSNHTLPDLADVLDRYQNRRPISTMGMNSRSQRRRQMPGNRNIMYLIIGALIVAVGVLGYNLYQTKKQPEGLQINVGPNGLKIQNK